MKAHIEDFLKVFICLALSVAGLFLIAKAFNLIPEERVVTYTEKCVYYETRDFCDEVYLECMRQVSSYRYYVCLDQYIDCKRINENEVRDK